MADLTPEVLWAQRSSKTDASKNFIYLTITVPDVPASNLKLDVKPKGLTFTGHSDSLKKTYHLELEFYGEIDEKETKVNHTGKNVELKLQKKELDDAYWPRLLKEAKKVHFLRTDFDKWVDEDEQNEAAEDDFSQFGGMDNPGNAGGMPGMGGGDFGGIDFSKLGGGGGMPGAEGEEEEEDGDEEDDDEMPPLEGEEDEEAGKGKAAATKESA